MNRILCLSTGLRPYLGAVSIDSEFRSEKTTDFLPSSSLLHSSDQSRHQEQYAKLYKTRVDPF